MRVRSQRALKHGRSNFDVLVIQMVTQTIFEHAIFTQGFKEKS